MLKFKAAILVELEGPLQIVELVHSGCLQPGQVLVKVMVSGICGSQLGEIDGIKGPDNYLPHMLGHEGSGYVIDVGPGVKKVKAKDKVVMHWRKSSGMDSAGPTFEWGDKIVNAGPITTFSEYTIVSENRLTLLPSHIGFDVGSLFGCAITTGFGAVINNAELSIGNSLVVYGAGGVGLNMVQAASLVSAYPIIAVDIHKNRLDLASDMGATHSINAFELGDEEIITRISNVLNGQPLDAFIDNTGIPKIIQLGYSLVSDTGRVVLVGVPRIGQIISIFSLPMHFGKKLVGCHGGDAQPEIDIPKYARLDESRDIGFDRLISKRYELTNINKAIDDMRNGTIAGRCIVEMGR